MAIYYNFIKWLGNGAFGEVWLVENNKSKNHYAAKRTQPSPDAIKMFGQECQTLQSLNHENIVRYVDHFVGTKGYLYIIMEYCGGGDLHTIIEQCRLKFELMSEPRIWYWALQIFTALEYLHSRSPKVLHRDLKPQNVYLTADLRTIKLGDFGLSRHLANSDDLATTFCGTMQYMSPDRCKGNSYNHKEDIWAAGCCVRQMMLLDYATEIDWDEKGNVAIKVKPVPAGYYSIELVSLTDELLSLTAAYRPDMSNVLARYEPPIHAVTPMGSSYGVLYNFNANTNGLWSIFFLIAFVIVVMLLVRLFKPTAQYSSQPRAMYFNN